MQQQSRMQPVAAHPVPHAHLLRVVHQIPRRVRLRPHTGRWTPHQKDRVAAALRRTSGVHSFRISEHSLTVNHSAPLHAVLDSVRVAIMEPCAPHSADTATKPSTATTSVRKTAGRQRSAARRLLACAVVSLAVALLPQPVAPAMIVLRLLACGIAAAVRYQAEMHASPCALTRLLDVLATWVGLARAENILRALLKHCAETVLKRWAEARLRQAFA